MRYLVVGLALLAWAAPAAAQEERAAKSKIVSAGLFKNGLAVIKRQIDLAGPGIYRLEDLPEPVHGTWWIESTAVVETTTKMREVEVPAGVDVQFQQDLAGKKVMVHFKGGKPEPVSGIVVKMPRPKPANPDSGPGVIPWGAFGPSPVAPEPANRFLILKTTRGRMFIDSAEIGILEAEGDDTVRKE